MHCWIPRGGAASRWAISAIRSLGKDPVGLQGAEALTTVTGKEYNIPSNN